MMKSQSYLSQKENAEVERFKSALSDILLEAAAMNANPEYISDSSVTEKFQRIIEESKKSAQNPFGDYASIFGLMKDLKVGSELLVNLDLEQTLKQDQTRALLAASLKDLYSDLRSLSSTLSSGPSSFLFFG